MNSTFAQWTLFAILTAVLQTIAAHAQATVEWVTVGGSSRRDTLRGGIALSRTDEIYLPGYFDNDGTWDSLQTTLYKYNRAGNQINSLSSRGESLDSGALDTEGNYLVTGRVRRPQELGMGVRNQLYIAKYSPNGTRIWERTAGASTYSASYYNYGWRIMVDSAGNSYVAGASHGPGTFGSATFPNTAGGPLLCKYDPNGTLLWAKRAEGHWVSFGIDYTVGGGMAENIIQDPDGNLLITGIMFNGAANFNGTIITIAGPYAGSDQYGAFVAKYSPAGQILWAKTLPYGGLAVDYRGDLVISGPLTSGQAQFDGTSTAVEDPSSYGSFVAKFSPAGTLLWAKAAPMGGLAADSQGNIYSGASKLDGVGNLIWSRAISGASLRVATLNDRDEPVFTSRITGTVHLDAHVVEADPNSIDNSVICKADRNGIFQWAFGLVGGGVGYWSVGVVGGREGAIYLSGELGNRQWSAETDWVYYDTSIFGSFPITLQIGGDSDIFLARISDPPPVELKIATTTSSIALSWPVTATNYVLEAATSLTAASWEVVTNTPIVTTNERSVQLPFTGNAKFFRLRKP